MKYVIKASWGNDSVALIQWAREAELTDVVILYNDTGWAADDWPERVRRLEHWAHGYGFETTRTKSIGFENLARAKKGFPRQGIQFCTYELKIKPSLEWWYANDPAGESWSMIGVRRAESKNRSAYPEWAVSAEGWMTWAPLVDYSDAQRDALLARAGVRPLPHRSMECFPCINSNRADIIQLAKDDKRVSEIEKLENDMGHTAKGAPRTLFRPYRYMGATGIREIVRWAKSKRGKFDLDDGNGSSGCEAGWCESSNGS